MIRDHLVLTQQSHTRHDSANAPKTCACVRNVFNSSLISNKCIDRHFVDAFVDMKRVLVVIFLWIFLTCALRTRFLVFTRLFF